MNALAAQRLYLGVHDAVWQPELRYAVFQHSAYLVQSLKHVDLEAFLHHVAGEAQARRSASDHGHLYAVARLHLRQLAVAVLALVVGGETLKVANGHGRLVHLQVYALALALLLLWTYTATDGRQGRGLP